MLTAEDTQHLIKDGCLDIATCLEPDLRAEIKKLKKEKNALILAHYYQEDAIQQVADYKGDSLALSQRAKETNADIIVFAGVHFMAETAKVLNPTKKVILPELRAGCSLSDSCPPSSFRDFLTQHPDHVVVSYINCSAEIKALSDIICTSSNALQVVSTIPIDKPIIFAPDKNLGRYIMRQTGREMLLWDGSCIVHEAFSIDKLLSLHKENPEAKIIAHPECEEHILKVASFIGSTTALLKHVQEQEHDTFIVATEAGILYEMKKAVPHKTLIPAPANEDNTCACSECSFMKMNTLKKLYKCIKYELPEIILPQDLIQKAYKPIQKMLDISFAP